MSVQKVAVDDNDASIMYSGQWSLQRSASAYENSLHVSSSAGASASLTFTGISVNIVGSIAPCTVTGSPVTYQVILDGSPVDWGTAACTTTTQNNVLFYSSTQLSNAQHKVTIIDEAEETPVLMLDLFAYVTGGAGTTAGGAGAGGSTTAGGDKLTSTASPAGQNTASSSSSDLTSSTTSSSTTSTGGSTSSTSASSSSKPSSGSQITTPAQTTSGSPDSLPSPTASLIQSNGNSLSQTSTASHSHSTGPIIGGIVVAVLVIILVLLFLLSYKKRKSRFNNPHHADSSEIAMPFNLRATSDPESSISPSGAQQSPPITTPTRERTLERINATNRPLERSMPNTIVPFILDDRDRDVVAPGSARPSSVIDPERAPVSSSSAAVAVAFSEKARLAAEAAGGRAGNGDSSSPTSSTTQVGPGRGTSSPATRAWSADEKRRSGPSSHGRASALPSDAAPAYILDPDPAPSPPSSASDALSPIADPTSNTSSHFVPVSGASRQHSHHHEHRHYPSGLSNLSALDANAGSGTATGSVSEVPPAYNDCCAFPGPHHHHH